MPSEIAEDELERLEIDIFNELSRCTHDDKITVKEMRRRVALAALGAIRRRDD